MKNRIVCLDFIGEGECLFSSNIDTSKLTKIKSSFDLNVLNDIYVGDFISYTNTFLTDKESITNLVITYILNSTKEI